MRHTASVATLARRPGRNAGPPDWRMDLKSGYPFWPIKNGLMHAYPKLDADLRCDVVVVGGGITGALVADALAARGLEVAVVEKRDIAWGSTAASTALLQYEIDTPLIDLIDRYGDADAARAYRGCSDAIGALAEIAAGVAPSHFRRCDSLYLASSLLHRRRLRREHAARMDHGLDSQYLDREAVRARYGIGASCALLTATAATVDPYRLTHGLLQRLMRSGVAVHDRTEICAIEPSTRGVELRTADGLALRARHCVLATGYEAQRHLPKRVAENRSSYALVTDPLPADTLGALRSTLVWESARPYLYVRPTHDGRLLIGGEDDRIDIPARRDRQVDAKARRLMKRVHRLWPELPLHPAYAWAGTFAETPDGLPYFGAHPACSPRLLFAMAYGGNGITFSQIGAGLLADAITRRRTSALGRLFSFARLER